MVQFAVGYDVRGIFMNKTLVGLLLIWLFSVCIGMETPDANESSKYLDAVRTLADKPEILFGTVEDC